MILKEVDDKMGLVESILTKTENIIKRHWKLLLLILFTGLIYWAFTLPPVDESNIQVQEEYIDTNYYEYDSI